jgi:uncharacterized protein (TIGR03118 family)
MKNILNSKLFIALFLLASIFMACKKAINEKPNESLKSTSSLNSTATQSALHLYGQINLVADVSGYYSETIDKNLVNAWGLAFNPSGGTWVASNHNGLSTEYDIKGLIIHQPITIPSSNNQGPGSPTGMVYNTTPDFIIANNHQKSQYIFASEDGTLLAWSSGNSAIKVVDRSSNKSVYKGLTLANDGLANYLYATDFSNGKIDIFDKNFKLVNSNLFSDPTIPNGYAPFNIQYLGGIFYVTYAKQQPDHHDDQSGPGNGYVNVFTPKGILIKRFVSRGVLNSPWGIAQSDPLSCENKSKIFIGNFGDGKINVFDIDGRYNGPLLHQDANFNHVPIVIDGLWGLNFQPKYVNNRDINALFFTAGPGKEQHGLFGYIHCIQPY